ncbi:MAG: SLC13/DASS family transporter [Bacteroidaceae bacterium]|nr:SLC13/DASS family transporter [Bacteroidaceae bacterium]
MFKNFIGNNLVEAYHRRKKATRGGTALTKTAKLIAAIVAGMVLWALPTEVFGIEGLTIVEQRVIAIFCFATMMWLTEAIPSWTTSVAIIVVLLFTCSDSAFSFLRSVPEEQLGELISHKAIMACFANPIIMLFIGGFILAIAATKSGLDVKLAKVLLKPFGTKSENVLLGFLLVTGLFSMFLSNTATAAMMLTFLAPVLKTLPANGKGKIALALAIPLGANIGGIGTPIGTPPNSIALSYLANPEGLNLQIGFGQWMMYMCPFVLVLLVISWLVLRALFPFTQKGIELHIEGGTKGDWRSVVVYVTFGITVLLWMFDKYTGVNSNVVAMLPVGVFCTCGIITRRDLEEINWSVLWMVAGGFALGLALQDSHLAEHIIATIPFGEWSPLLMILGSGLLCYAMANFISHTATANLLFPILALAGLSTSETLAPYGGVSTLLIGVAISSSVAMVLPISTPPNALAHATGLIEQKQMVRVGVIMGMIGLVLGYVLLFFIGKYDLFGQIQ